VPKVEPHQYAFEARKIGANPRVVYRAVAQQDAPTLRGWLDALRARGGLPVLVGAPSRAIDTALTLPQALAVCRQHAPELPFGGVLIPERHQTRGGEEARVWSKMQQGCRFFVSQTVWCVATTKQLLRDLRLRAEQERRPAPPILLTFSPCGSPQTLKFLEWLGVAVPAATKRELLASHDMLARSVALASDAFAEIRAYAKSQGLHVGCNVESVTARSCEVEASLELLSRVDALDRPLPPISLQSQRALA
jgi:5,10-methylenetetrahydrofolate reductase